MLFQEEYNDKSQEAAVSYQATVVGTNVAISLVGGLLGGSVIQALYMMFNQQQILILFLFMKVIIHSDVRFFIKKQSFMLLNFEFLDFGIPNPLKGLSFMVDTDYPQPNTVMREIDYESRSTFENNFNLFLVLSITGATHLFAVTFFWIKKKRIERKMARELGLDEDEDKDSEIEESEDKIPSKSSKKNSKNLSDEEDEKEGGEEEQSENLHNLEENSRNLHNLKEESNKEEVEDKIEEELHKFDEEESKAKRILIWIWVTLKNTFKEKIKLNKIWRAYWRVMIESFVGVLLTSIMEIKTSGKESGAYVFSYLIAWVCLLLYC